MTALARVETPLSHVEQGHARVDQESRCKALWAGVLVYLIKDALSYAKGQKVYGASELELQAAYHDVVDAGPMLRQVCGLLEIPVDYVQRVFRALVAGMSDCPGKADV